MTSSASYPAYDIKEIAFTNLILLGFPQDEAEAKHKISFSKDMFDLPNRKGMEVILHFLFFRLDSALAKQELRDCWPISDKKQEQGFRKACTNWLTNLAKEDPSSNLSNVTASALMSPSGERFYLLLLSLTTYGLRRSISQDFHSAEARHVASTSSQLPNAPFKALSATAPDSSDTPEHSLDMSYQKVLQARSMMHCQQFLEKTAELAMLRKEWHSYATELTDRHRQLSRSLRQLEQKNTEGL
eukprot:scpid68107/ scgid10210/ HAUS augmin-like complex subunit 6